MTPKHGEIVHDLGDGLTVAWDTTEVDEAKLEKVGTVSRARAAALDEILSDRVTGSDGRADIAPAPSRRRGRL